MSDRRKMPVLDAEFFEQETKRLGMSRAFWEGFKFGVSFGFGFAAGIFVGEMM
jgi:hypothetical protein